VALLEEEETGRMRLGEVKDLPGTIRDVLRAKAFIDEKGLLIVDNLIWSDKEKKRDVVRSEYEPEEPVPGRSETTVFIDPEGGLHVSGAEISEAD
jgi:hypothetical protein